MQTQRCLWKENEKLSAQNIQLRDRLYARNEQVNSLRRSLERLIEAKQRQKEEFEQIIAERDAVISELKNRLKHELALKEHDGTNTGIPTSQTPLDKKKVIPNSRLHTGRKKGGQPGHPRYDKEVLPEEEINETICFKAEPDTLCPQCRGSDFEFTGEVDVKYLIDVQITVTKKKLERYIYRCNDCGKRFWIETAPDMRTNYQYGNTVQALILSLMNSVNVPINKVRMLLSGATGGKIEPSEGYIARLQKKGAAVLNRFMEDLRRVLIAKSLVYWDDTVIMVNKERACLRFYGDETIAFYAAHSSKGMEGLDEDKILQLLTSDTTVMHDHNRVNYNEKYRFRNIECCQHLLRDLKKSADDTGHEELLELKGLISQMISKRKALILSGAQEFDHSQIEEFEVNIEDILRRAEKKNSENFNKYSGQFEKTLIRRIREYHDNYFAWIYDFSLPTTDNLSERALRCVKSHQKISGQFASVETANNFAKLKSYIETCRRNGINEIEALARLCQNNPYTVKEIFSRPSA